MNKDQADSRVEELLKAHSDLELARDLRRRAERLRDLREAALIENDAGEPPPVPNAQRLQQAHDEIAKTIAALRRVQAIHAAEMRNALRKQETDR